MKSEDFLKMSPDEFDQTPLGWRSLGEHGKEREAIEVIKEYLLVNQDIKNPHQIIRFHLGQLYAIVGETENAIDAFEKSKTEVDSRMFGLYTDATIAFLRKDLPKLVQIAKEYDSQADGNWRKNIPIIESFIKHLERGSTDYKKAYEDRP